MWSNEGFFGKASFLPGDKERLRWEEVEVSGLRMHLIPHLLGQGDESGSALSSWASLVLKGIQCCYRGCKNNLAMFEKI